MKIKIKLNLKCIWPSTRLIHIGHNYNSIKCVRYNSLYYFGRSHWHIQWGPNMRYRRKERDKVSNRKRSSLLTRYVFLFNEPSKKEPFPIRVLRDKRLSRSLRKFSTNFRGGVFCINGRNMRKRFSLWLYN